MEQATPIYRRAANFRFMLIELVRRSMIANRHMFPQYASNNKSAAFFDKATKRTMSMSSTNAQPAILVLEEGDD